MTTLTCPHIVKFSGGRSSGKMLLDLLEKGELDASRGDVVLFNNTTAEHPATYDFVVEFKRYCEEEHNIPFFMIEYQTYEDYSTAGGIRGYRKFNTYKLVNDQPFHAENNPHGYRENGQAFEEFVSHAGFLPNRMERTCTRTLKIAVTHQFLTDWFTRPSGIKRQGHGRKTSRLTMDDYVERHKLNRGNTPREVLKRKKKFLFSVWTSRPRQQWEEYTNADTAQWDRSNIKGFSLYGDEAIEYASYIGIRKDEERRLRKIQDRIEKADSSRKTNDATNQPPDERVLTPLIANGTTSDDVVKFWTGREEPVRNLQINPADNMSNCVFCPLKPKNTLEKIHSQTKQEPSNMDPQHLPSRIDWWVRVEREYGRDLVEEQREIKSDNGRFIGFFGQQQAPLYERLQSEAEQGWAKPKVTTTDGNLALDASLPCDCTD